jgi:hypothetical protein
VERTQRVELHEHYAMRQAEDLRYLEGQIDRLELSAPGSEASSLQATREELEALREDLRATWESLGRLQRADPDSQVWRSAREQYLQQHTALLRRTLELSMESHAAAAQQGAAAAP